MIQSDFELIEFWASSKKSKITRKDYRRIAQNYLDAAKPNSFRDIPGSFLSQYCARRMSERNRDFQESEYSQKTRIDILKSLYSFAHRQEYIRTNPAREIEEIKIEDEVGEDKILSEGQIAKLIYSEPDPRNRMVAILLYYGAFRVSELCNMKWENFDGSCFKFRGKGDKPGLVEFPEEKCQDLLEFKPLDAGPHHYIIRSTQGGGAVHPKTIGLILKGMAAKVGIKKRIYPHMLRHSHATHAANRNCPLHIIQKTLRHDSLQVTQKYLAKLKGESSGKYLP